MVMERASRLWRRKPSEKSPGGSDSSMLVSSHSEQCSDDQEILRPVSDNSSPCHGQIREVSVRSNDNQKAGVTKSLNGKLEAGDNLNDSTSQHSQPVEQQISSNVRDEDVEETMKSLDDKLSSALLTIRAKEDLVKQHAKVTEEAVAGWEQAEAEVTALKGLLEASSQKNAALEDRVSQLDKALKECVRQLRLAREEQEEKTREIVAKKSQVLESENSELRKRLELTRLEASSMLLQHDLREKVQTVEKENMDLKAKLQEIDKENMDLKAKLLVQSKDMKILLLERDLSNQAAEAASKQHLESVRKIARVEAECRRLQHLVRRTSLVNDIRPVQNNVCMELLTDSHSDNGEEGIAVADNELRNSDSWTSALIAEIDQFKNGKDSSKTLIKNPVEIDIMDDFLEMERLAALPDSDRTSSSSETDSEKAVATNNLSKVETVELQNQFTDLQEKFEAIATEKRELETALMEARNQLDISSSALVAAKNRLVDMQMQLDSANRSKLAALEYVERLDSERKALELQLESKSVEAEELLMVITSLEENSGQKELESQLELMSTQATELRLTVASLEERVQAERALSVQRKEDAEAARTAKEEMEEQLHSANTETAKLRDIIKALENDIEKEKALHEDLTAQIQLKIEVAVDSVKESLEAQLRSANAEVEKLRDIIKALEDKVAKGTALHEELAAEVELKIEANTEIQKLQEVTRALENEVEKEKALNEELSARLEVKIEAERTRSAQSIREPFEEQLQFANSEAVKLLRDRVSALERDVETEKGFSSEMKTRVEALAGVKRALESEVESAHQDARHLNQKVGSLEAKLREQKTSSAEESAAAKAESERTLDAERRLRAAERELVKLTGKARSLHGEVARERLLSEEYERRCRDLEARVSRDGRDARLWRLASSDGEMKAKKEKELANAAGKLAECQNTIASLGRQLKSLTDLPNGAVPEPELRPGASSPPPPPPSSDLRNGDAELAAFAEGLYGFVDLPIPTWSGGGSCLSPLPSVQQPSEMSVFAGGVTPELCTM